MVGCQSRLAVWGLGFRACAAGADWGACGVGLLAVGLLAVGLLVGFLVLLLGCCTAGLLVRFFSGLFDLVGFDCWVPLLLLGISLGLLGHWVVGLLGCWAARVV